MNSSNNLSITWKAQGKPTTDQDINNFELKAARRALKNIKTLLYDNQQNGMLPLIQHQIDEGDAYFKSLIAASEGRYRECRVDLSASGVSPQDTQEFRKTNLGGVEAGGQEAKRDSHLNWIIVMHPEHYAVPPDYQEGIIEVIGEHMARVNIKVTSEVPDWVMQYGDPSYDVKKPTIGELDDGSVLFYILHEFKTTEKGCDAILRLLFPEKAPEVMIREHAEHLCVEFRRGMQWVYEWAQENKQNGKE